MPTKLSDLDSKLDAATLERLGDPISYAVGDGAPAPLMGFLDRGETNTSFGGSQAKVGDRSLSLRVSDVPERPSGACTVTAKVRGVDTNFSILDAELDDSGRWWICKLKQKR